MKKFGIEETKELLEFGFDLKDFLADAKADGKIGFRDAFKLPGLIKSGFKGFGGIEKVRDELMDIDSQEKEILLTVARERYKNPSQPIEVLVEDTIAEALDLAELGFRWHQATRNKAA